MTDPYALTGRHHELDRLEWYVQRCVAVRCGGRLPPPLRLAILRLIDGRWRLGVGLREDWLDAPADDPLRAQFVAEVRLVRAGYTVIALNVWRPGWGGWVTDLR